MGSSLRRDMRRIGKLTGTRLVSLNRRSETVRNNRRGESSRRFHRDFCLNSGARGKTLGRSSKIDVQNYIIGRHVSYRLKGIEIQKGVIKTFGFVAALVSESCLCRFQNGFLCSYRFYVVQAL